MTVSQMVRHCAVPILSTMGEFPVKPRKTFFRYWPVRKSIIDKFAARGEAQVFQPHAVCGPLSAKDWGALVHRHLDHRLQQFGA